MELSCAAAVPVGNQTSTDKRRNNFRSVRREESLLPSHNHSIALSPLRATGPRSALRIHFTWGCRCQRETVLDSANWNYITPCNACELDLGRGAGGVPGALAGRLVSSKKSYPTYPRNVGHKKEGQNGERMSECVEGCRSLGKARERTRSPETTGHG